MNKIKIWYFENIIREVFFGWIDQDKQRISEK